MAAGSIVIDLLMKTGSFVTDTGRAEKSLKSFKKTTVDVGSTIKDLLPLLSAGAFLGWTKSIVDASDALNDLSTRTGVAVKDLASLELAAKLGDTSIESLGAGLSKLTRSIGQAEAGNKGISESLANLGVTTKDPVEGFLQLADAVANSNDRTKVSADLAQVLGKGYQELYVVLAQGREELEKSIQASEGYAIQQAKFAPQAALFNDQLDVLKQRLGQVGIAFVQESGMLQTFTDLTVFATNNTEALSRSIKILTIALTGFATSKAVTTIFGLSKTFGLIAGSAASIATAFSMGMADTMGNMVGRIVDAQRELDELQPRLDKLTEKMKTGELGFFDKIAFKNLTKEVQDQTKKIEAERNKIKKLLGDMAVPDSPAGVPDGTGIAPAKDTTIPDNPYAETTKNLAAFIQKVNDAIQPNKALSVTLDEQLASFTNLDPAMKAYLQNQINIVKTNEQGSKIIEDLTARQKRLKELLGQTTAGAANQLIKQSTKDVEILNQAYEAGEISLNEYLQAQSDLFGKTNEKINETKGFMKELGAVFSSAFEQAVIDGQKFTGILAGLANDIQRLITRKFITDPLMKGVDSLIENAADSFGGFIGTKLFSAKGNVFDASGVKAFATGGVVSGATPFTYGTGSLGVMGEAGPEAILPLSRIGGDLGVKANIGTPTVNVNIHEAAGTRTSVEKNTDASGNISIEVIVEQVESIMGRNIYRGAGIAPTIERRYGLNRAAGA